VSNSAASGREDGSDGFIPEGVASLESILCTEELDRRPPRPPDYETENRALVALAQALADSPGTILQSLADTICFRWCWLPRDARTHFSTRRLVRNSVRSEWYCRDHESPRTKGDHRCERRYGSGLMTPDEI